MPIRILKARDFLEHLTIFGLLSAVVLPPVYLPGYHLYLVTLLAPVIFVLFLGLSRGRILLSAGLIAVCGICLSALASIFFSYAELGVPHNTSDLVEVAKFAQFIPYIMAVQYFNDASFENKCHDYLYVATLLFIFVGLIQALNISPLVSVLGKMYGSSEQLATQHIGGRILITGSDPNISGAIALLFTAYNYFMFTSTKKSKYLLFAILSFYLLLMTQSRTVLIGFAFATCAYGILFSRSRLIARLSAVMFIATLLVVSIFYFNLEYVIIGLQTAEAGHNKSLNVRLGNILKAVDLFQQSILLGWGPAKAIHPTIIDSEYALILERYGLLGVVAFGFYIIHQFRLSLRVIKIANESWIFGRLSAFYILFSVVFMTTNNVFSGYQLMSILVLLLCVAAVKWRTRARYQGPRSMVAT